MLMKVSIAAIKTASNFVEEKYLYKYNHHAGLMGTEPAAQIAIHVKQPRMVQAGDSELGGRLVASMGHLFAPVHTSHCISGPRG